jgi:GT2 family glycosyltransferase
LPYELKYIVNFDNDIICLDNWLPPLIECFESDERIGIVGGKQWNQDKTFFCSVGLDLLGYLYKNIPKSEEWSDVLWLQGSFHMYRTEMMKRIGLHDTRFKIICSDSDYCIHANDRGWRVVFVPQSNVIHIGNASYGKKPVETSSEDINELIQKWYGIKFASLMKSFPMSIQEKRYIDSSFTYKQGYAEECDIEIENQQI